MNLVDEYKRNGFAVIDANDAVDYFPDVDRETFHNQFRQMHAESVEGYLRHVRMLSRMASTHMMFTTQEIWFAARKLGIDTPLFQTTPAVHVMAEDLKIAGGYDGIGAHQDWPALQSGLGTVVVWIPLFDCAVDNFPVEVVPGSHLLGLLPATAGHHISQLGDSGMEYVPVPVRRGQALLFSAFTIHRTRKEGKGFRIAFSHRYEDANDPAFIERGYPSAQSRVIKRELMEPGYPSVEQVRVAFK